jgi:hypothetical protein
VTAEGMPRPGKASQVRGSEFKFELWGISACRVLFSPHTGTGTG